MEFGPDVDYPGGSRNPAPSSGGGGIIGAIAQTGAALYDSSQNRKLSRENTDKTLAANKAESELAYQRSMEMWNLQNQYNTPQAQMQRFIDAGLNPHLIYGQGNSGNSTSFPQYQPPNMQYEYKSGNFGEAFASFLPTLMAVGTWLQNMRLSEAQIKKTSFETDRVEQVVDYLTQANPESLKKLQGEVQVLGGQREIQTAQRDKIVQSLRDLESEFRVKYGDDLWKVYRSNFEKSLGAQAGAEDVSVGGKRAEEFLQAKQKTLQAMYETKLKGAQASWTEFDITNPQQVMLMVLNGVLGMAGGALKLPKANKAVPSQGASRARPTNRSEMHPARRVQKGHRFRPNKP